MTKRCFAFAIVAALFAPTSAYAQLAPAAFTKVTLTDTTASALKVGCAPTASSASSCTGGIWSGPQTITGQLTLNGLLIATAAGAHTISGGIVGTESLTVTNTTDSTTSSAQLGAANSIADAVTLTQLAASWSTTLYNVQRGATLRSAGPGGLSVVTDDGAGDIRYYTGGTTLRGTMHDTGVLDWLGQINTTVLKTTTALVTTVDGGATAAFTANMVGSTGGPTTAAQNGWKKELDSTGATIWIPVWK